MNQEKQYQVTITRVGTFYVEATDEKQAEEKAIERLAHNLDYLPVIEWFGDAEIDNIELAP